MIIISEDNMFQYLGLPDSPLQFILKESGRYQIQIRQNESIIVQTDITAVTDEQLEVNLKTDKDAGNVGSDDKCS